MERENISPQPQVPTFKVNDLVEVSARTWPGINKLGGTAFIKSVNTEKKTYSVAYVLGGKEDDVDVDFIKKKDDAEDGEKTVRKRAPVQTLQPEAFSKSKPKKKTLGVLKPEEKKIKTTKKKLHSSQAALTEGNVLLVDDSISSCGDFESVAETESKQDSEGGRMEISAIAQTIAQNLSNALKNCSQLPCDGYLAMDIVNYFLETMAECESDDVELALSVAEGENKIMILDDESNGRVFYVV